MPQRPFQLFEISWEVCNKVGGIHTVLSSKATTAVERYGDDYVVVGPQLHSGGTGQQLPFDEEAGHEDFVAACRHAGVPVRVGRWRIAGRPRCILVGFSGLYDDKDGLLAGLWERHQVDSIAGGWDYVEPVLFSIAAARVIERWWAEYLAPFHRRAVVHAHEWMTGAALLQLQDRIPSIGTVFTTHATVLGRSLASLGVAAGAPGQPGQDPGMLGVEGLAQLAEQHGVQAKHSLEGVAARKADVLTTVSALTGDEVERLHARRAEPLLPNGIDLDVVDELVASGQVQLGGPTKNDGQKAGQKTGRGKAGSKADPSAAGRLATRRELSRIAGALLGEDVQDAAYVALAGRYEFHNKGIELLLDALAEMAPGRGRRVVAFVLVPAGNSGVLGELMDRLEGGGGENSADDGGSESLGICTHNLFDEDDDPLHAHCEKLGLRNAKGSRVKVVQIPIYLRPDDNFLHREYEAVLAAMDVGVYPSFYEPWGYTPQEALAVGVPTITSDLAGFGRWANANKLGPRHGITVIPRENVPYQEVVATTVEALEGLLDGPGLSEALRQRCREAAGRTAWGELYDNYVAAYGQALDAVQSRSKAGVQQFRLPKRSLPRPQSSAGAGTSPRLTSFEVAATLPQSLRGLERLARNFWWVWNPQARALFEDLADGFAEAGESPVAFLQSVGAEALQLRADDRKFQRRLARVLEAFDAYMHQESRLLVADSGAVLDQEHPIAYFSAEFGVHQSLPVYSGGLGILAGDHLKSASDLGLPLVGVGLFYRFGYMQQRLAADGSQIAADRENRTGKLAVELVRNADGSALEVKVPMPGRHVTLRAWCVMVGRVRLFLLDANVPSNRDEDRDITRNLYGGDSETRIQQEILLGRGGVRMLRAMDVRPAVYHMNEGHAAFLTLERVSRIVKGAGLPFEAAREYVAQTTLFTTHTPVPAGHDRFGEDLVRRYFGDAEEWVGLPWQRFLALGQAAVVAGSGDAGGEFNMTYLAMHFAGFVNGVSKLHGAASRRLLHPFWPGLLADELPIASVTNGIHLATWTEPQLAAELTSHPMGLVAPADFAAAARRLAPAKLWHVHHENKRRMLDKIRAVLTNGFQTRGDSPAALATMLEGLRDDALYLGFARRFAPYKRAHLLFSDPERLRRILDDAERPVRIVVAGKAHPKDQRGQDIMKSIVQLARSPEFVGRVFFVEDYDMAVARALVQGVDVWVNTPTRMEEASGTSGMKAAANGVLNLSIADGWWPEAHDGQNGWTIGGERVYGDQHLQDQSDATALYRLLEEELVPLFYARGAAGGKGADEASDVPLGWTQRMAHCLASVPPQFSTDRMVSDYVEQAYRPLASAYFVQQAEQKAPARERAREFARIQAGFAKVRIVAASTVELADFKVGQHLDVRLDVELGELSPEDVVVELVVTHEGEFFSPEVVPLHPLGNCNPIAFEGGYLVERAGCYEHGMRIRVAGDLGHDAKVRGLVLWA